MCSHHLAPAQRRAHTAGHSWPAGHAPARLGSPDDPEDDLDDDDWDDEEPADEDEDDEEPWGDPDVDDAWEVTDRSP